jgi:hypothetical protein
LSQSTNSTRAPPALCDVRKQYQRNRGVVHASTRHHASVQDDRGALSDDGCRAVPNPLERLKQEGLKLDERSPWMGKVGWGVRGRVGMGAAGGKLPRVSIKCSTSQNVIVPPGHSRYLADIADAVRYRSSQNNRRSRASGGN